MAQYRGNPARIVYFYRRGQATSHRARRRSLSRHFAADRQDAIFRDDQDREDWLSVPGDVCSRFNWRCHASCGTSGKRAFGKVSATRYFSAATASSSASRMGADLSRNCTKSPAHSAVPSLGHWANTSAPIPAAAKQWTALSSPVLTASRKSQTISACTIPRSAEQCAGSTLSNNRMLDCTTPLFPVAAIPRAGRARAEGFSPRARWRGQGKSSRNPDVPTRHGNRLPRQLIRLDVLGGAWVSLIERRCCGDSRGIRKNAHRIRLTCQLNHGNSAGVVQCSTRFCNCLFLYNFTGCLKSYQSDKQWMKALL